MDPQPQKLPPQDRSTYAEMHVLGQRRCQVAKRSDAQQCGNPAMIGQNVCRMHGGNAPQSKNAGLRRAAEARAAQEVSKMGLALDVTPSEALLNEVQWTAGHVSYGREQINAATELIEAIDMGLIPDGFRYTMRKDETDPLIAAARDARFQRDYWYKFYKREREHLIMASGAAIRGGVEERRVAIAEQQGLLVAGVVRRILGAFLQALLDRGFTVAEVWDQLASDIVPREFRQLGSMTIELEDIE